MVKNYWEYVYKLLHALHLDTGYHDQNIIVVMSAGPFIVISAMSLNKIFIF